jgi:hypothetical protein
MMQLTEIYGITESKKAELDQLTDEVIDAQYEVQKEQANVDALTAKSVKFESFLATADTNRTVALSNLNAIKEIIQNTTDLEVYSNTSFGQMSLAESKMKQVAGDVEKVIEELIFSVEVINKLSNLIIRKKASNPLISDEVITMLGTTGTDANNAVALTLVALKSVYAAQASSMESEAAASIEYLQSVKLKEMITGPAVATEPVSSSSSMSLDMPITIESMIIIANTNAKADYEKCLDAVNMTNKQLSDAKSELSKSETVLSSLQAGLAAANAAALAS